MVILDGDQHVRGLQVAVNDAFLVRMLDALTDLREQSKTLNRAQTMSVTVCRDRLPLDVRHGKVRPPLGRRSTIEDRGNRRVVHERQSLAFGLEAGHDLRRVHPRLDDLQSNLPTYRLRLLREPHLAHSPLADALEKPIATEGTSDHGGRSLERVELRDRRSLILRHPAPPFE